MSLGLGRLFQSSLKIMQGLETPFSRQIHHITGFNPSLGTRVLPSTVQATLPQLSEAVCPSMSAGGAWSLISTRFWRRVANDKEQKRVRKFSWKVRMSTEKGRMIIMKRILKGRFYLTH